MKSLLAILACFVCCTAITASGQRFFPGQARIPRKPPILRPHPGAGRAVGAGLSGADGSDSEAVALLRQMQRPLMDYSAEEQTWIAQNGGMISRQTIKGDTRGNIIRRYLAPDFLSGDVMLTGPNRYFYYRAATRTLSEVPPGGGQEDERDRRIVQGIKGHTVVARRTGMETVAGCNATIVLVSPANPQQGGYAKFWIDPATHIKLKIEIVNAANSKVSSSELSNLVVGPAANVVPRDFMPAQFRVGAPREVKRQSAVSLQAAMAQLSFHPVEPGNLPMGFHLDSIQVIHGPVRVGLFLRYTDGVSVFSITEHRVRAGQRPGAARQNADATHWYMAMGDYDIDVVYRGHLPAQQEEIIHNSLQPVR